jgi:hypothetical protein
MNLTKMPFLSFVRRYWWILVILYVAYVAARSNSVFAVLDVFAYLPLAFAAWVVLPLLWRNIFNTKTTDPYVDSGEFAKDFNALTPEEKVRQTNNQMNTYLIGSAIIIHALLANLFPGG